MKRIVLAVAAIMAVVTAAVWFAAEESYVLNVEANVGTALNVNAHGTWDLQNVFAQEQFAITFTVKLSDHFVKATQPPFAHVTGLTYDIGCQAKGFSPNSDLSRSAALGGLAPLSQPATLNLCPHITIAQNPSNSVVVQCLQGQTFCSTQVKLDKANPSTTWQLLVTIPDCIDSHQKDPLKKEIACTQDNPIQTSGDVFVLRDPAKLIQGDVPCVDNKKDPITVAPLPPGCSYKNALGP